MQIYSIYAIVQKFGVSLFFFFFFKEIKTFIQQVCIKLTVMTFIMLQKIYI